MNHSIIQAQQSLTHVQSCFTIPLPTGFHNPHIMVLKQSLGSRSFVHKYFNMHHKNITSQHLLSILIYIKHLIYTTANLTSILRNGYYGSVIVWPYMRKLRLRRVRNK